MARKRAAARDLTIPDCANPDRRAACEADPVLFLSTYFPEKFSRPFTPTHLEIIAEVEYRVRRGGRKAIAAERGCGKTTILCCMAIRGLLIGALRYIVFFQANGTLAKHRLNDVTSSLERNDLLAEDYPEVCVPIRGLAGSHQRAGSQTAGGERTHIAWTDKQLTLPTVPGSRSSGAIIACLGIDSAVHGMVQGGVRPDFILLDDIETEDDARSPTQIEQNQEKIEKSIAGLAGPGRALSQFYLCTIWAKGCCGDLYTDRAVKPAWTGARYALLQTPPHNEELWTQYIELRQKDQFAGDPDGRTAHRFYGDHRGEMDDGAVVSDPLRFEDIPLPDGSRKQISTLQWCYDYIADNGRESFASQCQNQPAEGLSEGLDLTESRVQTQLDGRARGFAPIETEHLVAGVDLHGRHLDWGVWAMKAGTLRCVDYGVEPVASPMSGSLTSQENVRAVANAITAALCELRDRWMDGWPVLQADAKAEPAIMPLSCCLIDTGYMDEAVWAFLAATPGRVFRAVKGCGTGRGQQRYRQPKRNQVRLVGAHWFANRIGPGRMLYVIDADFWKLYAHSGFQIPQTRPASLALFGENPVEHRDWARQFLGEQWTEEYHAGSGYVKAWKRIRPDNHSLDVTAYACAAASILGMHVVGDANRPPAPTTAAAKATAGATPKLSMAQRQAAKRAKR